MYVCVCMYLDKLTSAMHTPLPYTILALAIAANKYFDQLTCKQLSMMNVLMCLKIVWLSNNNGVLVCLD